MIANIRQAGYDRILRAGQSLTSLLVSRSRRHGLREGQPLIAFDFRKDGMNLHVHIRGAETYTLPAIAFTPEVEVFLKRLVDEGID